MRKERQGLEYKVPQKQPIRDWVRDRILSLWRLVDYQVESPENLSILEELTTIITFAWHWGHLDAPAVTHAIPVPARHHLIWAAGGDYWRGRDLKRSAKGAFSALVLRSFPVARAGARPSEIIAGLDEAQFYLESGWHVALSPEGTRSGLPEDKRKFHKGVGDLVLRTQGYYPVLPILLHGLENAMPRGANWPRIREPVVVQVGEPLFFSSQFEIEMISPGVEGGARRVNRALWRAKRTEITEELRQVFLAM